MKITIRADSVEIEGYVNAVGRDSRRMTDEYGNDFVEQIQPGTFALALSKRTEPIQILLNHNKTRVLGDNTTNLTLEEDSIGLHAGATITDPEVIELARSGKLVGWSFGFKQLDCRRTYDYDNHIERSVVTELDLIEVSIIDDTKLPCYAGTSIHSRAEEISTRAMDSDVIRIIDDVQHRAEHIEEKPDIKPVDYSRYHDTLKKLRGEKE